jgi:hypothetical protein
MSLEELRELIGLPVSYRGTRCCVLEVLEDAPALVLVDQQAGLSFQADQFGDPGRQVPSTYVVPVWAGGDDRLHEDFLSLELLDGRCQ